MAVIVYKAAGPLSMNPGQVINLSEGSEFDTITERWYYGDAANQMPKAGDGTPPTGVTGGSWIFIGPSDVERLPGGAAIATLTWRGLMASNDGISVSETRAVRETNYDDITGIPGSSGAVHGRILDQTYGVSVRSVSRTENRFKPTINTGAVRTLPSDIPVTITVPKPTQITTNKNTYCYPYGWICYSWQQEEPIKGMFLVTAEYRYEHQVLFG